jgi:hypothetical protein
MMPSSGQPVGVGRDGSGRVPTSLGELAVDHVLLATPDLATASRALGDATASGLSRVATIRIGVQRTGSCQSGTPTSSWSQLSTRAPPSDARSADGWPAHIRASFSRSAGPCAPDHSTRWRRDTRSTSTPGHVLRRAGSSSRGGLQASSMLQPSPPFPSSSNGGMKRRIRAMPSLQTRTTPLRSLDWSTPVMPIDSGRRSVKPPEAEVRSQVPEAATRDTAHQGAHL